MSRGKYATISNVFHLFQKQLQEALGGFLRRHFQADVAVQVEQPKQASFGELALPVAFQLAKALKKPPKAIAAELSAALPRLDGVKETEVAGNGYLNIRIDRGYYGLLLLESVSRPPEAKPGKIVVEHTNINPNKAAHIGHLRNAVLGDTFVRMLKATGHCVETQNYIDNTGVQVADVVAGFRFLRHMRWPEVYPLTVQPRFDYVCWDLYAQTSQHYKDNPESVAWRQEVLHSIESGEGELARIGHTVADAIVECHLATMRRLGITYDVLPRESEILHLQFWAKAFEQLKERKAIYLEEEGKNKGCWVMPGSAFSGATNAEGEEDNKVIVRSNGTVTYVGKDIAYQMWKFGVLGKDFHYRVLKTYEDGHVIWISTTEPAPNEPAFGHATQVFNVIDSRQSYLQDVVVAGLRQLGYPEQAAQSVHFSYEMVALSPRTCVELGIELSEEDQKRPYVEVSGRKGLGVKADDLIDKLIEAALGEVESRHPGAEANRQVATDIAVGALRYFLLKFTRNTVIAFDFQEALSFQGDTGPYVQYAAVRARKILRNYEERFGALPDFNAVLTHEAFSSCLEEEPLWQMLLACSKAGLAIEAAVASGEPSQVSRFAFNLAQSFSTFYHDYPVVAEENARKRALLVWMTQYFSRQLEHTLSVLGIRVPAYM